MKKHYWIIIIILVIIIITSIFVIINNKKNEDIENNRYALAYAASKYFNTTETGNKQVDKYILQMQQKYDKII